jgi:cation diffusion facilitator family transporter
MTLATPFGSPCGGAMQARTALTANPGEVRTDEGGPGRIDPGQAAAITRNAAVLSVGVALFLILLKGWSWIVSGSVGMLASLADSTLDLAASLFTYFAVRYAAVPPDREHRFGHGKAESFAGLFQAGLVAVSGGLIAVEAIKRMFDGQPVAHASEAIGVMAISIAATAALVWAQGRAIAQTGSVATQGDRAHYAADLIANVAVIVGIALSGFLGWAWADAAMGLFVAAWLAHGAWKVARQSADHLMDRELSDGARAQIQSLALEGGDIIAVHDLRTRAAGPYVHIQFHADLDPDLPLRRAHTIIVAAEARIRVAFPGADVIIHPDPVDAAEPHGHEYFAEGRQASSG